MAGSDRDLRDDNVFLPDTPLPRRSRAARFVAWGAILGLIGVTLLEGTALFFHARSIEKLRLLGSSQMAGTPLRQTDVAAAVVGWPGLKKTRYRQFTMVVYTWSSVFGRYRLRALLRDNGDVVQVDADPVEEEDFTAPILTQEGDRVTVHNYSAPASPSDPVVASRTAPAAIRDPLAAIEHFFSEPAQIFPPGLICFPVIDEQSAVIAGGAAVSMIAQFSTTYTPRKRSALDPRQVRKTLVDSRCWNTNAIVDADRIDLCLAAANTSRCVITRLVREGEQRRLIVEFRAGSFGKNRSFVHDLKNETLRDFAPLIVYDVFESLQEKLTEEERTWIRTPQFQTEEDAIAFVEFAVIRRDDPQQLQRFHDTRLAQNPDWIAGWDLLMDHDSDTVFDDVPSTFGFAVRGLTKHEVPMALSELTIELTD